MTNEQEFQKAYAEVEAVLTSFFSDVDIRFADQVEYVRFQEAKEHLTDSIMAMIEDQYARGFDHGTYHASDGDVFN